MDRWMMRVTMGMGGVLMPQRVLMLMVMLMAMLVVMVMLMPVLMLRITVFVMFHRLFDP
jgi:hypothetical protein